MKPENSQKIDKLEAEGTPIAKRRGGKAPKMLTDMIASARESRNMSELNYSIREISSFIQQCREGIARKGL